MSWYWKQQKLDKRQLSTSIAWSIRVPPILWTLLLLIIQYNLNYLYTYAAYTLKFVQAYGVAKKITTRIKKIKFDKSIHE
jgi:hypothetical protein